MVQLSFILLTICFAWLVDMASSDPGHHSNIERGILKSVKEFPQLSLHLQQAHLPKVDKSTNEVLTPKILQKFLSFLSSISPPHQFYLLYDYTFPEMDKVLKTYSKTGTEYTILRITPELDPLFDILSIPDAIVATDRRHILVLCSIQNIATIFEMVTLRNFESPLIWWVVLVIEKEATLILERLLREGSQVIVVQMVEPDSFKLFSSRINNTGMVWFQEVGKWKIVPSGYYSYMSAPVFIDLNDLYSNFEGRLLTVTANNQPPYISLQEQSNGDLLPMSGHEANIIKSLGSTLNYTYRMMLPPDGKWGGPLSNGSVIGMIGVVFRREADFAICDITITGSRETVIDFTYPHYTSTLTLTSRSPKEKNKTFAAFSPFNSMVWICIFIATIVMGPLVFLESWILNQYQTQKSVSYDLDDSSFNMFRSLVKQGNLLSSEYWPHIFIFMFWDLFCLIISALYSGMVIASLVTPSFEKPIDSLTDLPQAIEDGFTLGTTAATSEEYMFKEAKEGIYKDTWELFNHKDRSKSFGPNGPVVFSWILKRKFIFVCGELVVKFLSMKEGTRRYHFARETFAPQHYGMACYTGAPFLPKFNQMLSYLTESGLITKWLNDAFLKEAVSNTFIPKTGPKAFTINHLQSSFYILLFGFSTAAIALIFELLLAMM